MSVDQMDQNFRVVICILILIDKKQENFVFGTNYQNASWDIFLEEKKKAAQT